MRDDDDWPKRNRDEGLTPSEIQSMRACYDAIVQARGNAGPNGIAVSRVARDFRCSSRTVRKYFKRFGGPINARPKKPEVVEIARPKFDRASRFYKSDFVPS